MVEQITVKKSKNGTTKRMNLKTKTPALFEDVKVNVKITLSLLWIALLFFYVYNDILTILQPGSVAQLVSGELEGVQFTQIVMLGAAIIMSIPSIMIVLSMSLSAKTNRSTNLGVGIFHAVLLVGALFGPGELWAYYAYNMVAEGVIIALIVWTAWKWPRMEDKYKMEE
jgi:hypothetical protein